MPCRATLHAPKLAKALTDDELGIVLATIAKAADGQSRGTAARDFVMVKGSYLIGCRVTELCRLRWQDIEPLEDGAHIHLLGKGSKALTVRTSKETLALFESLGRGEAGEWLGHALDRSGQLVLSRLPGASFRR
ncbi:MULTISPECIES: tyrosine-type recombinase/integrase [unclassified Synechococcus]|uniref:tyrosine-type recombinase/integrase n=1 Tax=unclassified Synechococcus TaxID=2626047 RepID=UPI0020014865|nr:tyrosine-type recombinase/integrase [Synechococcus sp. A10-1-5-1]UPM49498.1 hypothetical protein MY494_09125 [Synechococcus sp. A10-1-5-1]